MKLNSFLICFTIFKIFHFKHMLICRKPLQPEVLSLQTDFSFTSVRCSKVITKLRPLFYVHLWHENVLEKTWIWCVMLSRHRPINSASPQPPPPHWEDRPDKKTISLPCALGLTFPSLLFWECGALLGTWFFNTEVSVLFLP